MHAHIHVQTYTYIQTSYTRAHTSTCLCCALVGILPNNITTNTSIRSCIHVSYMHIHAHTYTHTYTHTSYIHTSYTHARTNKCICCALAGILPNSDMPNTFLAEAYDLDDPWDKSCGDWGCCHQQPTYSKTKCLAALSDTPWQGSMSACDANCAAIADTPVYVFRLHCVSCGWRIVLKGVLYNANQQRKFPFKHKRISCVCGSGCVLSGVLQQHKGYITLAYRQKTKQISKLATEHTKMRTFAPSEKESPSIIDHVVLSNVRNPSLSMKSHMCCWVYGRLIL